MAKKGSIRGNADGKNGENQSYTIKGRGTVTRTQLVREIKQGKHEGVELYKLGGKNYGRTTRDGSESNNIDV